MIARRRHNPDSTKTSLQSNLPQSCSTEIFPWQSQSYERCNHPFCPHGLSRRNLFPTPTHLLDLYWHTPMTRGLLPRECNQTWALGEVGRLPVHGLAGSISACTKICPRNIIDRPSSIPFPVSKLALYIECIWPDRPPGISSVSNLSESHLILPGCLSHSCGCTILVNTSGVFPFIITF